MTTGRSPIAESVFQDIVNKRNLSIRVESAGTAGYHVGSSPDERSQEVAALHNVPMTSTCRKLTASDFTQFDIIVGSEYFSALLVTPCSYSH